MAFDTLSYARRLKQTGMPEAVAEATATRSPPTLRPRPVSSGWRHRKAEFSDVRHEIENVRHEIAALRTELKNDMAALEARMIAAMDSLGLRLTIRLGSLSTVGVAGLAAIIKL
jgi:hypothetical protein